MTNVVFEVYGKDGVLQLDIASSLPKTLGRIDTNNYIISPQLVSAKVEIPGWIGKRPWFCIEGSLRNAIITAPRFSVTENSISFWMRIGLSAGPYIKYGFY